MLDGTERLRVLLVQEETIYKTSDYLKRMQLEHRTVSEASPSDRINRHWRELIVQWKFKVIDHFKLQRETVSISMNHMDRCLSAMSAPIDSNFFQLLALTCLYLAIKLNEYEHLVVPGAKSTMASLLLLGRGQNSMKEMEQMEYDVLLRLQWHCHPPIPQDFVEHFLDCMSIENLDLRDLARFLVELALTDYYFAIFKPSEIAVAAIATSKELLPPKVMHDLDWPMEKSLFDFECPRAQACKDRLASIYAVSCTSESSSGDNPVSPVSVRL